MSLTETSKFLSYVLRHAPESIGVAMDGEGWVSVDELIEKASAAGKPIDLQTLREVVETSNKKRFTLSEDGARIRAAQGHSVEVDTVGEPVTPPPVLFHGTATRFLQAILEQGYSRTEACQALAISKNTLSQLERINRLVPLAVGEAIGAAPGAGRPKWTTLATAFEKVQLSEEGVLGVLGQSGDLDSDGRLDLVLKEIGKRGKQERSVEERSPVPGVQIKSGKSGLSVTVKRAGENTRFADWLDQNLDQLIQDSFDRFQSESHEG